MSERYHWETVKEVALQRGLSAQDADWAGFAAQSQAVVERQRVLQAVHTLFGDAGLRQVRGEMGLPRLNENE